MELHLTHISLKHSRLESLHCFTACQQFPLKQKTSTPLPFQTGRNFSHLNCSLLWPVFIFSSYCRPAIKWLIILVPKHMSMNPKQYSVSWTLITSRTKRSLCLKTYTISTQSWGNICVNPINNSASLVMWWLKLQRFLLDASAWHCHLPIKALFFFFYKHINCQEYAIGRFRRYC